MPGVKGNRRTLYSKMIIKESLIKLLQTKDIHKITVTDICKEADINRGTFYTHYNDPLDLLQNIEDELFNKILEYLSEDTNPESLLTVLTKVFELAKDNKELCKILLFKEGNNRILNRILYIANNDNIIKFQSNSKNVNKTHLDYMIRFTVSGAVGVIEAWLENDLKESPREIAEIINSITIAIMG
ncbi:MAG: TetR/AcrR family transcriptional regulator [Clostridium sp.]|nr:TetR/AcrR family transcriptional regulator [Clostridium sp.]